MEKRKIQKKKRVREGIAWAVVIAVSTIGIIIAFMTNETTTYTTTSNEVEATGMIKCVSKAPKDTFFGSGTGATQEVKITFDDDEMDKIAYRFENNYESAEAAEAAMTEMHADYNIYMGERGLNAESLSPVFTANGQKVQISLYAESNRLKAGVDRVFLLGTENRDVESLRKAYSDAGFTCSFNQ